jgi:hypothetical protein
LEQALVAQTPFQIPWKSDHSFSTYMPERVVWRATDRWSTMLDGRREAVRWQQIESQRKTRIGPGLGRLREQSCGGNLGWKSAWCGKPGGVPRGCRPRTWPSPVGAQSLERQSLGWQAQFGLNRDGGNMGIQAQQGQSHGFLKVRSGAEGRECNPLGQNLWAAGQNLWASGQSLEVGSPWRSIRGR